MGESLERHIKVKSPLANYVIEELRTSGDVVFRPNEDVEAFMEWARPGAEAVAALLDEPPTAHWDRDLARGFAAPIPNLIGVIDLQRLFMLFALDAARRDEAPEAIDWIIASERLSGSLREDPITISRLIAVLMAKERLQLILRLANRRQVALPSLQVDHEVEALQQALWIDRRMMANLGELESPATPRATVLHAMTLRASLPTLERLHALDALDSICDRDVRRLEAGFAKPESELAEQVMAWDMFVSALDRVLQLALLHELTAIVLDARQHREDHGSWPATVSEESRQSLACPGDRWLYQRLDDGRIRVSFGRRVRWRQADPGQQVPLIWTSSP